MKLSLLNSGLIACSVGLAHAGGAHLHVENQADAILSQSDETIVSSFDVLAAHVHRNDRTVTFHMTTAGQAGQDVPQSIGTFGGASVWSYVWPTHLDPSAVGFEAGTGILALAATSHPDFDDTPLFDGPEIAINVTFANADVSTAIGTSYDGVTSALRVNADLHAPLLCVENVFDVASGDLSLPGVIK